MKGTVTLFKYDQLTVHEYMSPEDGELTCSHVLETENKLIIIDVQLLRSYASELRAYADNLNKPIERVIITHLHPDHWFGLEYFTNSPVYALPEVREQIQSFGEQIIQFKKPEYGDLIADKAVIPAHDIRPGQENIDGVSFIFSRVANAEIPVSLLVELPIIHALVAQDLVYNQVYLVVGEKDSNGNLLFDGWITALTELQKKKYDLILPGHGKATDSAIFPELIEYIKYVKGLFESGIEENALKAAVRQQYPHYRVPGMLDLANMFLYHQDW